jgi:hypothetical protein
VIEKKYCPITIKRILTPIKDEDDVKIGIIDN